MRALTVRPGDPDSGVLSDVDEPAVEQGSVLVAARAVGICGTDQEILAGEHGAAPDGTDRLVIGHESLGDVLEAPADSGLTPGDLVVGIVRRPDPVPCRNCAAGEFDMCRNGRFTEHGITGLDGFARERWRVEPGELVRVDAALGDLGVLLEPTSIVAKAWEHLERIGRRAVWEPEQVLVTGAGPVGLLAAMLAVQRGLEVHVLDRATDGPKPALVEQLGASYHVGDVGELGLEPDIVIECTGAPVVIEQVLGGTARNGIVCLTGVSSSGGRTPVDVGGLNREWVLDNDVVFGTVNANRRHYAAAAEALAAADREWLEAIVTRRVPIEQFAEALEAREGDVKTVLTF